MIDMHSHILPGLDDGSPSLEVSLQMAHQAYADGITWMAATPHGPGADLAAGLRRRDAALTELRQALQQAGLPLRIIPGMEFMAGENILEKVSTQPGGFYGTGATAEGAATHLMLIELFLGCDLTFCSELLFHAQLKNITLVLAHPERYPNFLKKGAFFQDLLEKGLYLQFNAHSLANGWLNRRQRNAILKLIRFCPNQIVLGSDAHDTSARPARLSEPQKTIEKKLGKAIWQKISWQNSAQLLHIQ